MDVTKLGKAPGSLRSNNLLMTRLRLFLVWSSTLFVATAFILNGSLMFGSPAEQERFRKWGYADWFRILLGVVEIAAGVLLLFPRAATAAAAVLAIVTIGAIFTLFRTQDTNGLLLPALLLWMLTYIGYTRYRPAPWGKRPEPQAKTTFSDPKA
jgi:putative oxidoreductase